MQSMSPGGTRLLERGCQEWISDMGTEVPPLITKVVFITNSGQG